MKSTRKLFRDLFTEKDNKTYDVVRVVGFFGFVMYLLLCFIELFHSCKDFNLLECAEGIAIILGVIGAGVTFKYTKE